MKQRNSKIEIVRFIAALYIFTGHMIGWTSIWCKGWLYVDFFYMITGYYTIKGLCEYKNIEKSNFLNKVKFSLQYTYKKFIKIFPYLLAPAILQCLASAAKQYIINNHSIQAAMTRIIAIPFEITFLHDLYPVVSIPTWFLSAMFIAFPLFILININLCKKIVAVLGFIFAMYIYIFKYDYAAHSTIKHIIRCYAGLFMGECIYYIADYCISKQIRINLFILNFIEITLLLLPALFLPVFNISDQKLYVLSFIVYIFFANIDINIINSEFVNFLGKLSMPIYTWHALLFGIINLMSIRNILVKYIITLILIFVVSFANIKVVDFTRSVSGNRCQH